jgi:hypothetical protein
MTARNSGAVLAKQVQKAVEGDFPAAGRCQAAVLTESLGQHALTELLGLECRGEHIHGHGIE